MNHLAVGLALLVLSVLLGAAGMILDTARGRTTPTSAALLWSAVPLSVLAVVAIVLHLSLEVLS